MMGALVGHGLVVSNCPDLQVDPFTCIWVVDGYIRVELILDPEIVVVESAFGTNNYSNVGTPTKTVDFYSIDGFAEYGIPISAIINGGYMINIPASSWPFSTFSMTVMVKDTDGSVIWKDSYYINNINICKGAPSPPRLGLNESDDNLKIFPNPVYKDVNIEIPILQSGTIFVQLFNEKGQLVYANSNQVFEHTVYHEQINNLDIPKGVYICQIATDYGKTYTSKMVKL